MTTPDTVGAFAIVPSSRSGSAWGSSAAAATLTTSFDWLGLRSARGAGGQSPWRVPEEQNPFGVFIPTPEVGITAAGSA